MSLDDELGTVLAAFERLQALGVTEDNYDSLFSSSASDSEPRSMAVSAAGERISLVPSSSEAAGGGGDGGSGERFADAAGAWTNNDGGFIHHSNARLYAAVLERTRAAEGRTMVRAVRDGVEAVVPAAGLALLSWRELRDAVALPPPATAALLNSWGWAELWQRRLQSGVC